MSIYFGYRFTSDGYHDEGTQLLGVGAVYEFLFDHYAHHWEIRITDETKDETVMCAVNGRLIWPPKEETKLPTDSLSEIEPVFREWIKRATVDFPDLIEVN